mmetsp:Transcript_13137/g.46124  ORF Transcript_13137/g.46124 Transcript_13137/m.46124 type:complete len:205 (-) Transcript_13137:998-1612(-)
MSAILEARDLAYPLKRGKRHTRSFSFSLKEQSSDPSSSLLQNTAGTSVPRATRPAPVRVAASMSSSGFSSHAATSASAITSRPSASVLPISVVMPFLATRMSPGRKETASTLFSAAAIRTRSLTFSLSRMIMWARPRTSAEPPMSFFICRIPDAGLMSSPPVSNVMPFPTSVTLGSLSFPHRRSISLGACFPGGVARPTAWICG